MMSKLLTYIVVSRGPSGPKTKNTEEGYLYTFKGLGLILLFEWRQNLLIEIDPFGMVAGKMG